MTERIVIAGRRHGESLRRIQRSAWDAWWDCRWRAHLPCTAIEFDSDGRLYIRKSTGARISVDRARKKGKLPA